MTEFKELKYLRDIKSSYIRKGIFLFLNEKSKLNLIMYNMKLQDIFGIDILDYKEICGKYIIGEKNGKGREYDFNDNLIFEGEYLNGKRNGKGKQYDLLDKLEFEGEYLNGKRNGKGEEYYSNGELKFKGEYLNGKRNGKGKEYYEGGILKFKGEYLNGKIWNGKGYNKENDKIDFEIKDGKGHNIKEYDEYNRQLLFEGEYFNGEKNGKGKQYHCFGNLIYEGEYVNGKMWNGKVYTIYDEIERIEILKNWP